MSDVHPTSSPSGGTFTGFVSGSGRCIALGEQLWSPEALTKLRTVAKRRFASLRTRLRQGYPTEDPDALVADGRVLVDGHYVTNPDASVAADAAIVVERLTDLRGETKLGFALDRCGIPVQAAVALDVGAAAGGFTTALLARGASRVYALDAGHGQLLGSLRQDPRVVNLEATNVGRVSRELVPDVVGVVSVDVSYLTLRAAVQQLAPLAFADGAHLIGLVKPMFELALPELPSTEDEAESAVDVAVSGIVEAGWRVVETFASAVTGRRGATEYFVHAILD